MRTLLACLLAVPLAALAATPNGTPSTPETAGDCRWTYEGSTGPEHWWKICPPRNALCKEGKAQSPIVLDEAEPADLPELEFDYHRRRFDVNEAYDGQELQAQAPQGAAERMYFFVGTEKYRLVQFHFHTPCEHCPETKLPQEPEFPMELHLVHSNDAGEVAVVGVFLTVDKVPNAAFQAFLNTAPGGSAELQPLELLPARRGYTGYAGSLTTPACAEGIRWHVLQQPITVSREQIEQFRRRYPYTRRPPQPREGRPLLRSRD